MSGRRMKAGVALTGFIVALGLATACVIGAVLSFGALDPTPGRPQAEATVLPSGKPTATAAPKSTVAATHPAPMPTMAAATPEPPPVLNKGAAENHPPPPGAPAPPPVAVGDCVSQVPSGAPVQKAGCDSTSARYKVTGQSAHCAADADRTVPVPLPGGGSDNLCMDYNWVTGSCVTMSGNTPNPTDCATPGRLRVVQIRGNTTDVDSCTPAERGFVYNQRHYVVCVTKY
ncbi:MAG: hypothetical protein J2P18_06375 [Nocardia sp.]|nr:hypothetical protein [Nocardia sp.]